MELSLEQLSCMEDSRCRLCLFDLKPDDLVISRIKNGDFSPEFVIGSMRVNRNDSQTMHRNANGQIEGSPRCPIPFFHAECLKVKQHDIRRCLATGQFTFEPTFHDQARRFERTKNLLAQRLGGILQDRLQAECMATVVELLVHECATITNEQQFLGESEPDSTVRLDRGIYATYCAIDGLRYVKNLTNTVPNEEEFTVLSKEGQNVSKVYIAEDYRGIRAIKCCFSSETLSNAVPITDSYWRTLSGLPDNNSVVVQSDGVKVRDLIVPQLVGSNSFKDYTRWSNPAHPPDAFDIFEMCPGLSPFHKNVRMNAFDCNAGDITGYTVVTDGDGVVTVHAHRPGEKARFYAEINHSWPGGIFLYMPLDKGEYVTEICRRFADTLHGDWDFAACLAFITNKGRINLFGSARSLHDCPTLETLVLPSPEGSTIYINDWRHDTLDTVRYMASDGGLPLMEKPMPSSLIPDFPNICTRDQAPWFMSSCSMDGALEITICRNLEFIRKPITAILVEYEDGHRECLGQFRFDKSLEKLRVDAKTDLYFGTGRTMWGSYYVEQILTYPQLEKQWLRWMRVSREGILEWWSSYQHSVLRHLSAKGQVINLDRLI